MADDDARGAASTRDRILRAALEVIAEHGVDAVTHRAVAARAGVSPGSTTHHFTSRDDLVREAFRAYLRDGERFVRGLLARVDRTADPMGSLREQLGVLLEREVEIGLLRAEYEMLLYATAHPDLAAEVRDWEARVVGVIADLLEAAGVDRPITLARSLLNLQRGFELERLIDPSLGRRAYAERLDRVLVSAGSPDRSSS